MVQIELLRRDPSTDQTRLDQSQKRDVGLLTQIDALPPITLNHVPGLEGIYFRHPEIAFMARKIHTSSTIGSIMNRLHEAHTLDITVDKNTEIAVGGKKKKIAIVHATEAETGTEMSPHNVWIRDQTLIGKAKMDRWATDKHGYQKEGELAKDIIVSTLDIMSTPAQLKRFDDIIDGTKDPKDYTQWPQIFLETQHIDSEVPNDWRHSQDAWQMLAYTTFSAIDKGLLSVNELEDHHKKFLGATIPFLEAVNFINVKNSGSWEELMAKRTSVLGVETAMLAKIKSIAYKMGTVREGFEFLEEGYQRAQDSKAEPGTKPLHEALTTMIHAGLSEIAKRLPDETPRSEADNELEYRTADAALIYLFNFGIPKLLADDYVIDAEKRTMTEFEIEMLLLHQINKLKGDHGFRRYGVKGEDAVDTYQGANWLTHTVREEYSKIKKEVAAIQDPEQRLIIKFKKRKDLVGEEKPAEWTLFDPQLASHFAKQARECGDPVIKAEYEELAFYYLNRTLSHITGPNEFHTTPDNQGIININKATEMRIPECYYYYQYTNAQGHMVNRAVASVNLPLNWSVEETHKALALNLAYTRSKEDYAQAA